MIIETTQKQFDEKREVVEEIVKILERNSATPLSYDKQQVISEFERQLGNNSQSSMENLEAEMKANYELQLSAKNQEVLHLTEQLSKCQADLNNYRLQLEQSLQEKETEINNLSNQLSLAQTQIIDSNSRIKPLEEEMDECRVQYNQLHHQFTENQAQLLATRQYYDDKCREVESITTQMASMQQQHRLMENELESIRRGQNQEHQSTLESLNQSLQQKMAEYDLLVQEKSASETSNQGQLTEIENRYHSIISNKDQELLSLQTQLNQYAGNYEQLLETKTVEVTELSKQLQAKIEECQKLEQQLNEHTTLMDEENKQLSELGGIIEEQVIKIESLKTELYAKSNDYDSLVAEMDLSNKTITKQPSASSSSLPKDVQKEDDLTEAVSRAELDLALYMLHQRDVRCEELTVELTQLLEERDTLQLRLSNAIREKEELRRKGDRTDSSSDSSPAKALDSLPSTSGDAIKEATPTEEGAVKLATKLSELKTVGYKKDKTFVDEQELRRMQQLSIMQQHINEASKLPAEAAAKLVDASYTLSRDVQSPSKVLLNWLWGRSTPKQNDT